MPSLFIVRARTNGGPTWAIHTFADSPEGAIEQVRKDGWPVTIFTKMWAEPSWEERYVEPLGP